MTAILMLLLFIKLPVGTVPPPGSKVRITDSNNIRITDNGNVRITDP